MRAAFFSVKISSIRAAILALMASIAAVGCFTPSAHGLWQRALERRNVGDSRGQRLALVDLAERFPETRWGRRAQMEIQREPDDAILLISMISGAWSFLQHGAPARAVPAVPVVPGSIGGAAAIERGAR